MNNDINKYLFGNVDIHNIDFDFIKNSINNSIREKKKISITYANSYSIVRCRKNLDLLNAFNNSDLVFPDGTGIYLASKILYRNENFKRFNWTDCSYDFLKICEENKWKIFFLGASKEILNGAVRNIKNKYPSLLLTGAFNGYEDIERADLIDKINESDSDILWVGMGTPKQELWIDKFKENINVPVIQSCGGLFNYFAGKLVRGPLVFRKLGLEWIFRVIVHPKSYFRRYIIGIPIFIYIIIKQFLKINPD